MWYLVGMNLSQQFWDDYLSMHEGVAPKENMQWHVSDPVRRYIGPGSLPYDYSLSFYKNPGRAEETKSIFELEHQLALAQSRNYEWKLFENPPMQLNAHKALENIGLGCKQRSTLLFDVAKVQDPSLFTQVKKITDPMEVSAIRTILYETWGHVEESLLKNLENTIASVNPRSAVFLAFSEGEPAACGWVRCYGEIAYLFGGSTRKRFRGRGLYKQLVAIRSNFAKKIGAKFVVSECSPDSERVLRKLNFHDGGQVFRFEYLKN